VHAGRSQRDRPNSSERRSIRLNNTNFVAIDPIGNSSYEATYRPPGLYNRATKAFMQTMKPSCSRGFDKSADLSPDTGPTDFIFTFHRAVTSSCGHVGRVHLRLRWPTLLRRPRFGMLQARSFIASCFTPVGIVH